MIYQVAKKTGHNRDGKNQWMWGFISGAAAHFSIHASRGKKYCAK